MIRLRVFGAPDLRDSDDVTIDAVLAQPKRLALLAYLAVATPRGFQRRDVLVALLWPELDQVRARNALSQALYHLRRSLGASALVARGDEEIALADTVMWCDVRAFDDALTAGRVEDGIALYTGDLLPGFFVSGAADWDHWLDQERTRLRARASLAAWTSADGAATAGEAAEAARRARWAASLTPDEEASQRRLISLLDRIGDRVGALRAYDALARRLATEYQAEPSSETQRLIRLVRERADEPNVPIGSALHVATNLATVRVDPFTTRDSRIPPDRANDGHRRRRVLFAAVVGLGIAASVLAYGARARTTTPARDTPSIAVLPFLDLSASHDAEYLADGIAEELTDALNGLDPLRVTSRTSAFAFKGKATDARTIGRVLGVRNLLEGSLRTSNRSLRITVQLIDAETGYHRWSRTYERDLADVFAVEDDVAHSVANELRVQLASSGHRTQALASRATGSAEAYRLYLLGRYYWNQRTSTALDRSIKSFEQAIAIDSTYASAYAGIADVYNVLVGQTYASPDTAFPKARAAALRALSLDSTLAEAHAALGFVDLFADWDGAAARRELDEALAIDGDYVSARLYHAFYYLAVGRPSDAVTELRRAQMADPLSLIVNARLGYALNMAHRFDDAIAAERHTLEIDSTYGPAYWSLGDAYAFEHRFDIASREFAKAQKSSGLMLGDIGYAMGIAGDTASAHRFLRDLDRRAQSAYVDPYDRALVFAGLGDRDSALYWLEIGRERHSSQLIWLRSDPMLDGLRSDARFEQLVRKVGMR